MRAAAFCSKFSAGVICSGTGHGQGGQTTNSTWRRQRRRTQLLIQRIRLTLSLERASKQKHPGTFSYRLDGGESQYKVVATVATSHSDDLMPLIVAGVDKQALNQTAPLQAQ